MFKVKYQVYTFSKTSVTVHACTGVWAYKVNLSLLFTYTYSLLSCCQKWYFQVDIVPLIDLWLGSQVPISQEKDKCLQYRRQGEILILEK